MREEPQPQSITVTSDARASVSFTVGRAAHGHP
jgi:hypothetical protein